MSTAGDIAKVSAKGGFNVLWGLVISTIISSVGTIFLARLLGSDEYGLYTIALTAPNLILIFRDWGMNSAMVKFTAQYRAEGRADEVRSIFLSGLILEIALGLVFSLISFAFSDFLATSIFSRPLLAPLIQIVSFTILIGGIINAATAAFTGMEKMAYNSIMIICQSIIKTFLIILLVILGFGTSGAVVGFTVSALIAGLIGIALMSIIYKALPKPISLKLEIGEYIKIMLKYGVPLSLANIITGFLTQFYVFLLPIHYVTDNTMIGNYGIALSFVVLIGFFATPIITILFPAFSKLSPKKDAETLKNVYRFSIKYASLLVVPVAVLIMCLSEPAVTTLFGVTYEMAPLFLALLAVSYLYTAFGSLSTSNFINSQGQTKLNLKLTLVTAAIGFPMGSVLILQFGVLGLIITTLTAGLPSLFVSLFWITKHYGLTVDWGSSARILLSSAISGALTFLVISQLGFASWIRLIVGVFIFVVVLVPAMLFSRAITKSDVGNLRSMIGGLGALGGLIGRILNLLEKIIIRLKL